MEKNTEKKQDSKDNLETKENLEHTAAEEAQEKDMKIEAEKTAAEEAQEKDLQLEAEMLMKSEGIEKIYRAGDYWFRDQGCAEVHANAVGGKVKIFEKE